MKERHKTNSVVFLILLRQTDGAKEILLQLRQNTGYMDDMWDMAVSGYVEKEERLENALIREAKEEINIGLDKNSISFVSLDHKEKENYYNFFFVCDNFENVPIIMEPDKCARLQWFDLTNLPDNIIDHSKRAISRLLFQTVYEIH